MGIKARIWFLTVREQMLLRPDGSAVQTRGLAASAHLAKHFPSTPANPPLRYHFEAEAELLSTVNIRSYNSICKNSRIQLA